MISQSFDLSSHTCMRTFMEHTLSQMEAIGSAKVFPALIVPESDDDVDLELAALVQEKFLLLGGKQVALQNFRTGNRVATLPQLTTGVAKIHSEIMRPGIFSLARSETLPAIRGFCAILIPRLFFCESSMEYGTGLVDVLTQALNAVAKPIPVFHGSVTA